MNGDTQAIPNPVAQQGAPQNAGSPAGTPQAFESGNPQLDNLIKVILSSQQQRKTLPQPVPNPVPGQVSTEIPDYMKQGRAWGPERFMSGLGTTIRNSISQYKAGQLAKAESEWNQLSTLMQDSSPEGNQKTQAWLISNQKALKGMSKALNQDWLNPEKTTVYNQALNKMLAQQGKKAEAKQGMMDLFKKLIGRANQPRPQLDQTQQAGMAQEIMGKAPMGSPSPDYKDVIPLVVEGARMKSEADRLASQEKRASEKEDFDAWKLSTEEGFKDWQRIGHEEWQSNMERLNRISAEKRSSDHDLAMLKAEGMRLSAADRKALEIKPSDMNKEINSVLTDMRQQRAGAEKEYQNMTTQASKSRWYHPFSEAGGGEVENAKKFRDSQDAAINFIDKNRAKILREMASGSGESDTLRQAQDIAAGRAPIAPPEGAALDK